MSMTKVENEHEQLVSMLNQLLDEREILTRENEYFKAKLNESILMETIKEMKKERDLLFKLLTNLTINNQKDEQLRLITNSSLTMNHTRVHRLKPNIEQQQQPVYAMKNPDGLKSSKHSQSNKKMPVYKPSIQEPNISIRKHDIQLKHSQNSPFQHYRSQSLQDLT